jgi:prepilin-type N-terminal cleavage/methylation domain-containing protein
MLRPYLHRVRKQRCPVNFSRRGFSLVELLLVIGLMGVLASMSGPVMRSLGGLRNPENVAEALVAFIQQARSQAVLKRSPVIVAFSTESATELVVAAFAAKSSDVSDVADSSSLSKTGSDAKAELISKPLSISGFTIDADHPLLSATEALSKLSGLPPDPSGSFSRKILNRPVNFNKAFLILTDGQIRVERTDGGASDAKIRLYRVPMNLEIPVDYTNPGSRKEARIIRINGSSGRAVVLNPETDIAQ